MKKEVNGKMQGRSRKLAAAIMAIVAIATIAYAQATIPTLTINTADIVTNIPGGDLYIPARGAREVDIGNIELTFPDSNYLGLTYRVRVELAVDEAEIYTGLRSLVVRVKDSSDNVKAILTLNTPYDEFTVTPSGNPPVVKSYSVHVTAAAGEKPISGATIRLRVTIVGVEQP